MHSYSFLTVTALALGSVSASLNAGGKHEGLLVERVASSVYDSSSSKHNPRAVTHEKRFAPFSQGPRQASINKRIKSGKHHNSTSSSSSSSTVAAGADVALSVNITTPLANVTVATHSNATYHSLFNLTQSYAGSTFLDGWDFFNYADPTHGQVNFLNQADATTAGLAYTTANGTTVLKTDDTTWLAAGASRNSIRITSKKPYTIGSLVVLDAAKLPYGPATWPAFWSTGTDWPSNGEIDIIEGVHNNINNQMTLHTLPGCTVAQPFNASGTILVQNCDATLSGNLGCGVLSASTQSYGAPADADGGGVYAMFWDTTGIRIWNFARNAIPADLTAGQPVVDNWGLPSASWGSSTCDMNKFFGPQTIVFDITLCGDWAGATYNSAGFTGTCSDAVANPTNFVDAYWEVNYVKVYSLKA